MPTFDFNTHINTYSTSEAWSYSKTKPKDIIFNDPGKYTVKVDYPFEKGFTLELEVTKPMTAKGFMKHLKGAYKKHYQKIENETIEDGYWHGIGDLYLEEVVVTPKGKVSIYIGS